jgi:mannitol/fructose-specific phosphotransferase system IIA component (Ntr-type)
MKKFDLSDALHLDTIYFGLDADDQYSLIQKIARLLDNREEVLNSSNLEKDAIEREKELPTSIEGGIAMPHARCASVNKLICAFVRPKKPIDFFGPDEEPSDLIFFSAIPHESFNQYLHLTAQLIRQLNRPGVKEALRTASKPEEVLKILGV